MFYLILTVFLTATLIVAFKVFDRLKVDIVGAIVCNYWTCVICGSIVNGAFPISTESLQRPWALPALLLGSLFFSLFNLIGWCTVRAGVAATSVANKLSMVIPAAASVWLYGEELGIGKIAGILIAAPAVYFTTRGDKGTDAPSKGAAASVLLGLAVLFIGSGLADTIVKWSETNFLRNEAEQPAYLVHLFAAAASWGTLTLLFRRIRTGRGLSPKSMLAGILLGIPNYFSIHYLILLLRQRDFLQSSAAIPVVNIGVVLVSTLAAVLLFREKVGRTRILGLALSIVALLLIALSDRHG